MPDVIVVGAGSAGGVLAARLAEDSARSVVLLEAGPDYGSSIARQPPLVRDASDVSATDHDWGYASVGGDLPLYAGKLVGGSSATNNVTALRGHPSDYDAWAASGNPGWSIAEVLPTFERLESDPDFESAHGRDGPVPVRRPAERALAPAQRAFLAASEQLGHERIEDHNAPGASGAGPLPLNAVDGVRQSVALTYLASARERPNLTIRSDAHVERVLVENGRAIAGGERLCSDRVVLSAGSYGSPAILLRSGIGPAEQLRALGLPVLHERPGVGRGLQDHPLVRVPFTTPDDPTDGAPLQTLLTARSDLAGPGPDLQVFPSGPAVNGGTPTLTLLVALVKPASRGELRLSSAVPAMPPAIDPGLLRDPHDVRRMRAGIDLGREIAATAPLGEHLELDASGDPAAAVGSYQHPVGTCRVGSADDPGAVVDSTGRVHAMERLSVIDASIMPEIPSANTNLPTLMLAERLYELAWS